MSTTSPEADFGRVGVDIGGTFTDVALEYVGQRYTAKVLTTHRAPEEAVLDGLRQVLNRAGCTARSIGLIIHGTTLATNALIERKGAKTALITTAGFRDVIEMGTESRFEQYDLNIVKPTPLVPRRYRFPVPERMSARGDVLLPIDVAAVDAIVPELERENIESVAIGFLHSFVNPDHECQVAEHLSAKLPALHVSLSSEVSPEIREYERISTTCANAYLQPLVASYLERLEQVLVGAGFTCPFFLMLSSGGIALPEAAKRFPVRLIESGPAGGAVLAAHVARTCKLDSVLSFDMGGTTAKICLIDNAKPQTARAFEVARAYRFKPGSGLPIRIPVVEMVEIGAGGGSIAAVDTLDRITVGPQSAGSDPGPACYDRGGDQPTVTDADVLVGNIAPSAFAGSGMRLSTSCATRAIRDKVAGHFGHPVEFAAHAILEFVDENMANAAREHATESGKSLHARTIVAFGGSAPLHAARMADKLHI
ncbi:MAG: hydantoinase/oxoprolinase family protein, partial [Alphaproteobacteria bacterium]|nr:hydantoinase/oxoprolinase family protein [Alphaproteobacteria bacterium]